MHLICIFCNRRKSCEKRASFSTLLLLAGTLCGCAVRSISNSGYPGDFRTKNPYYSGALSEMAVLGSADGGVVSEADIKKALENRHDVKLKRGASIVVIQSGAISPDEAMLDELRKSFMPVPFSGIPSKEDPQFLFQKAAPRSRSGRVHAYPVLLRDDRDRDGGQGDKGNFLGTGCRGLCPGRGAADAHTPQGSPRRCAFRKMGHDSAGPQ